MSAKQRENLHIAIGDVVTVSKGDVSVRFVVSNIIGTSLSFDNKVFDFDGLRLLRLRDEAG